MGRQFVAAMQENSIELPFCDRVDDPVSGDDDGRNRFQARSTGRES